MSKWTLFSNHGHVLLVLARDPDARLRDVAQSVGITERAVQKIVRDLQDGGMISISKHGRRNRYRVHTRKSLRHALESHRTVGHLVGMMQDENKSKSRRPRKTAVAPVSVLPERKVSEDPKPMEDSTEESIPGPFDHEDDFSEPPFEPDPDPEFAPETEYGSDPAVGQAPEPDPEAVTILEPESKPVKSKPRKKKKPVDDQQGSLF